METELQVTIKNDVIEAKINIEKPENYTFAFYILQNGKVIQKSGGGGYSVDNRYSYDLIENGIYSVTAFIKNVENEKKIITSKKFQWIKNFGSFEYIRIEEIELTNICNLNCKNCCTPTSKYAKGYLDDQTFLSALSWMQEGQTVNYHRIGEPLLHPKVCDYVGYGVKLGRIKPNISTNGLLLTEEILDTLYKQGLRRLVITLHTKKSVEAFKMAVNYFEKNHIKVCHYEKMFSSQDDENTMFFAGKVLDFNSKNNRIWFRDLGITEEKYTSLLQYKDSHTWAGNVEGTKQNFEENIMKERQKACYFINKKVVNMRWDGTIVGCCFDSENENEIGHIRDFANLKIKIEKYKLCKHCDANWAVQQS